MNKRIKGNRVNSCLAIIITIIFTVVMLMPITVCNVSASVSAEIDEKNTNDYSAQIIITVISERTDVESMIVTVNFNKPVEVYSIWNSEIASSTSTSVVLKLTEAWIFDGSVHNAGFCVKGDKLTELEITSSTTSVNYSNTPTQPAKPTDTPTPTATSTPTPTPTATPTPKPTATLTPIPTATPVPKATNTPVPTSTPVPKATNTPVPQATNTPVPQATNTPIPQATNTPVPVATNTPVPQATNTPVPVATNTPIPEITETPVSQTTDTPKPTNTPVPKATATPTAEATETTESSVVETTATPSPTPTAEVTETVSETSTEATSETGAEETQETVGGVIVGGSNGTGNGTPTPTPTLIEGDKAGGRVITVHKNYDWLWILLVILLGLLLGRIYRLRNEGYEGVELAANIVPIPALTEKLATDKKTAKPSNNSDINKSVSDEPKVVNGYLQKKADPMALRPIKSNVDTNKNDVKPVKPVTTNIPTKTSAASSADAVKSPAKPLNETSVKSTVAITPKAAGVASTKSAGTAVSKTAAAPKLSETALTKEIGVVPQIKQGNGIVSSIESSDLGINALETLAASSVADAASKSKGEAVAESPWGKTEILDRSKMPQAADELLKPSVDAPNIGAAKTSSLKIVSSIESADIAKNAIESMAALSVADVKRMKDIEYGQTQRLDVNDEPQSLLLKPNKTTAGTGKVKSELKSSGHNRKSTATPTDRVAKNETVKATPKSSSGLTPPPAPWATAADAVKSPFKPINSSGSVNSEALTEDLGKTTDLSKVKNSGSKPFNQAAAMKELKAIKEREKSLNDSGNSSTARTDKSSNKDKRGGDDSSFGGLLDRIHKM